MTVEDDGQTRMLGGDYFAYAVQVLQDNGIRGDYALFAWSLAVTALVADVERTLGFGESFRQFEIASAIFATSVYSYDDMCR